MSEIWVVEITKDDGATWYPVRTYGIVAKEVAESFASRNNEYYSHKPKCSYWRERPARYVRAVDSVMENPMDEPADACRGTARSGK